MSIYRLIIGVPAFAGSLWAYYVVALPVLAETYGGPVWPIAYVFGPIFALALTGAFIQKVFKDILITEESARYSEVKRRYEES